MSEIFREVDEDIRSDQLNRLWKTYGIYVIATAVGIVVAVAGNVGWKEYTLRQQLADGSRFVAAAALLDDGQPELAARRFAELAVDAATGYGTLARLREAESLADDGNTAAAVDALDLLAADADTDPEMRDLARYLAVLHLVDQADPAMLEDRLAPLLEDGSPWRSGARELEGLVAMREGETERARTIFADLSEDATTPPAVRSRAGELLAILGGSAGSGG